MLTLTLNRPDKLNSFNEEMHLALRAGFERAADDAAVRAVLLTGAGRGFSAGQDLGDRDPRKDGGRRTSAATLERLYNPTLRLIRALEKPVVCAVNGVAAGAGANIALRLRHRAGRALGAGSSRPSRRSASSPTPAAAGRSPASSASRGRRRWRSSPSRSTPRPPPRGG